MFDAIRVVDLEKRTVTTVAGTGDKGTSWFSVNDGLMPALTTELRSPWSLEPIAGGIAVAMAGSHQIWLYDPQGGFVKVLAGKKYAEGLKDGAPLWSEFAQPSGFAISADGQTLYIADSESSAIRALDVTTAQTTTLVGTGLFDFGDKDGIGDQVLLQHALGVELLPDGKLMLADTYNDKLKILDPATKEVTTLVWDPPGGSLHQPRGISRFGDLLYITDTNNHRVLTYNLTTGEGAELPLPGLKPPALGGFIATD